MKNIGFVHKIEVNGDKFLAHVDGGVVIGRVRQGRVVLDLSVRSASRRKWTPEKRALSKFGLQLVRRAVQREMNPRNTWFARMMSFARGA